MSSKGLRKDGARGVAQMHMRVRGKREVQGSLVSRLNLAKWDLIRELAFSTLSED